MDEFSDPEGQPPSPALMVFLVRDQRVPVYVTPLC